MQRALLREWADQSGIELDDLDYARESGEVPFSWREAWRLSYEAFMIGVMADAWRRTWNAGGGFRRRADGARSKERTGVES